MALAAIDRAVLGAGRACVHAAFVDRATGQALGTPALAGLVFALIGGGRAGLGSCAALIGGAVALAGNRLVTRDSYRRHA